MDLRKRGGVGGVGRGGIRGGVRAGRPLVDGAARGGPIVDLPADGGELVDPAGECREGEPDLVPAQTLNRVVLENPRPIVPIDEPVTEDG